MINQYLNQMFKSVYLLIISLSFFTHAQDPICVNVLTKAGFMSDLLNKVVVRVEVESVSDSIVEFKKIDLISGIEPDSIIHATWKNCPIMETLAIGKEFVLGYAIADSAKTVITLDPINILPIESDSVSGYIYPNTNYSYWVELPDGSYAHIIDNSTSEFITITLDSLIIDIDNWIANHTTIGYKTFLQSHNNEIPKPFIRSGQLIFYVNGQKVNLKGQRLENFR